MEGDGRIEQVAAQRPHPRQNAILARAGKPRVADHIRDQDRGQFPGSPTALRRRDRVSRFGSSGKASGGHRKDARGMSMHWAWSRRSRSRLGRGQAWKQGPRSRRVEWPVYPRRAAGHNPVECKRLLPRDTYDSVAVASPGPRTAPSRSTTVRSSQIRRLSRLKLQAGRSRCGDTPSRP